VSTVYSAFASSRYLGGNPLKNDVLRLLLVESTLRIYLFVSNPGVSASATIPLERIPTTGIVARLSPNGAQDSDRTQFYAKIHLVMDCGFPPPSSKSGLTKTGGFVTIFMTIFISSWKGDRL
jgi:hypothetical protein